MLFLLFFKDKENNKHDIEFSKFAVAGHGTIKTINSVCQNVYGVNSERLITAFGAKLIRFCNSVIVTVICYNFQAFSGLLSRFQLPVVCFTVSKPFVGRMQ